MSTTASLDTNVLLRFATKDVPTQFESARTLLASTETVYVVADAAWVELAFVLERHYGLGRAAVVDTIRSLMTIDSVSADVATIEATCQGFVTHPKLSFADCYLAARAASTDTAPLYTFDKKLANQHPAARLVPTPPG